VERFVCWLLTRIYGYLGLSLLLPETGRFVEDLIVSPISMDSASVPRPRH
jgi:hypothetical protein